MSVIGLFVALSQVDFMLIRLAADLVVNHFTTYFFLRGKSVNPRKYEEYNKRPDHSGDSDNEIDNGMELLDDVVVGGLMAGQVVGGRRDSLVPPSDGVPR